MSKPPVRRWRSLWRLLLTVAMMAIRFSRRYRALVAGWAFTIPMLMGVSGCAMQGASTPVAEVSDIPPAQMVTAEERLADEIMRVTSLWREVRPNICVAGSRADSFTDALVRRGMQIGSSVSCQKYLDLGIEKQQLVARLMGPHKSVWAVWRESL